MITKAPSFPGKEETVPVILQDEETDKVIAIRYINQEAYQKSIELQQLHVFNPQSQKIELLNPSNHGYFKVSEFYKSGKPSSILAKGLFSQHRETSTEFGERNNEKAAFLNTLKTIIRSRKNLTDDQIAGNPSYTKKLMDKGLNKVAQKVGEEAVELILEAKDNNKELFLGEAADLIFHYLVLLEAKDIDFDEVIETLISRHRDR